MRSIHFLPPVIVLALCANTVASAVPLNKPVESVKLGPGGAWLDIGTTHLALNSVTNRLLTVLQSGSVDPQHTYKVLSFDGSTDAAASEALLDATDGIRPIGLAVSTISNDLLINWGGVNGIGTERQVPHFIERFDLDTFLASNSVRIPVRFHVMDIDEANNRLVGISEPVAPATDYALVSVDLANNSLSSHPTSIAKEGAIAKDAIFDVTRNRLWVLFSPTQMNDPNTVKNSGFLARFDPETGSKEIFPATFEGLFYSQSLTLSPDGKYLAAAHKDTPFAQIPIFDAESGALLPNLPTAAGLASAFEVNGAAAFVDNHHLWLANASESDPAKSIAVYDVVDATVAGFIANASESEAFSFDAAALKVYVASQNLGSMYVLAATAAQQTTQLDVTVSPLDMISDPVGNIVAILSDQGRLYLVADVPVGVTGGSPHYLSRQQGLGANPRAGLVPDPERERLLVGRQPRGRPRIVETNGYGQIGELPTTAEAVAVDQERNLIYTSGYISINLSDGQIIHEIDGHSLQIIRAITTLPGVFLPPGESIFARLFIGRIGMKVDPASRRLWVLSPGFLSTPTLFSIDLVTSASLEYTFPFTGIEVASNLILDATHGTALVVLQSLDSEIFSFNLNGDSLTPLGSPLLLPDVSVNDSAEDLEHGLVYYLIYNFSSLEFQLAVLDVNTDPPTLYNTYSLDFLSGSNQASLAFNPQTNRFAVASAPDSQVTFFDSPVDPVRRPGPGGKSGHGEKAVYDITAQTGQTFSGIEFSWQVPGPVSSQVRGWVIERRRDPGNDQAPFEDWIRLTPLPLPSNLTNWTDTTAQSGVSYLYRIRANVQGVATLHPALLGPVSTDPGPSHWLANVPEVAVTLLPGGTRELLLSVAAIPRSTTIVLNTEAAGPLMLSVTPTSIPLPGTARLLLQSDPGTPQGIYAVSAMIQEGTRIAHLPVIVHVLPAGAQNAVDRISRQTTHLFLSSDTVDLYQERMSVRGQLGILRREANPTGILVQANLPNNQILSASGVVAPTGEFTAEFNVPANSDGDWLIRATWPGSLDSVGGSSGLFSLPVFTGSRRKGIDQPPDLGALITVAGQVPPTGAAEDMSYLKQTLFRTFFGNRLVNTSERFANVVRTNPTKEDLKDIVRNKVNTNRYVLFYLLGDSKQTETTTEFVLSATSSFTPSDLKEVIAEVHAPAVPLVVLDCPNAGAFADALQDSGGAYLFSCQEGFQRIRFGVEGFTDWFLLGVRGPNHLNLLESFEKAKGEFEEVAASTGGGDFQRPTHVRADQEPYKALSLGSAFTPPRELIEDHIPPEFISVSSSKSVVLGGTSEVSARAQDAPFNLPLSCTVEVNHPDGWVESIPLVRDLADPHLYKGTISLDLPGQTGLNYYARDDHGNFVLQRSSVIVPATSAKADGLVNLLNSVPRRRSSHSVYGSDLATPLFWTALHWRE
jgi:WD40 repeat protein